MHLKTTSFPHQQEAVKKLSEVTVGALFMEQGTGKTRTALELALLRLQADKVDRILWFCPNSVIGNLKVDIEKHSEGMLEKTTVVATQALSSSQDTYLLLRELVKKKRIFMIVDESILIKNYHAIRSKRILKLGEFCKYKLILNGTPIAKNELDLYNQMSFLSPKILGYNSHYTFWANHVDYDTERKRISSIYNKDYIYERIAPFVAQVLKKDCLNLPEKNYTTRYIQLNQDQQNHYNEVISDLMLDYEISEKSVDIYRMFAAAQAIISGMRITQHKKEPMESEPFFKDPLDNTRLSLLVDIVEDEIPAGEKVIIWVKYTHEILTLMDLFGERATCLYGELNRREREQNIADFRDKKQIFIANKTCGGYGLNLQFCHNVIYYENDYDYAIRIQSEDRTHRMGQEHQVNYIDICAINTLDEHILDVLRRKANKLDIFRDGVVQKQELRAIFFREKNNA